MSTGTCLLYSVPSLNILLLIFWFFWFFWVWVADKFDVAFKSFGISWIVNHSTVYGVITFMVSVFFFFWYLKLHYSSSMFTVPLVFPLLDLCEILEYWGCLWRKHSFILVTWWLFFFPSNFLRFSNNTALSNKISGFLWLQIVCFSQ